MASTRRIASIPELIERQRVIVCLGPGGVGKTTLSAAIALEAACHGRRVHCLTIDPARRLTTAIGIDRWPASETVDLTATAAREVAIPAGARLEFSILAPDRILDRMIARGLAGRPSGKSLFQTPMVQDLFLHLAGMTDVMAIERLVDLREDPSLDLIVIDTSPAAQTMEFLGLPGRIAAFLSGSAGKLMMRWARSFEADSLTARSINRTIRGLSMLAGQEGLDNVMRLLAEGTDLLEYLKRHAGRMTEELKGGDVSTFLITSPEPLRAREALRMLSRLSDLGLRPSAMIFNRVHPPPHPEEPSIDLLTGCFAADGAPKPQAQGIARKLLALRNDRKCRVESEKDSIRMLTGIPRISNLPTVRIPVLDIDTGSFRSLKAIADQLACSGEPSSEV